MKRAVLVLCLVAMAGSVSAQPSKLFYNIDREVTIKGLIRDIVMEPRYENTAPFLVIGLEEKTSGKLYMVEISPAWFFDRDFHKGESLQVTGSLSNRADQALVIARLVTWQGEMTAVRDKHGFPNWRGGRGRQRRRRKR